MVPITSIKAIHINVPGDPLGAIALCFRNAQELGEFALMCSRMAKYGKCNVCLSGPEQSPQQAAMNVDIAAAEALTMSDMGVSRVSAPAAKAPSTKIVVPSAPSKLTASLKVVQPTDRDKQQSDVVKNERSIWL